MSKDYASIEPPRVSTGEVTPFGEFRANFSPVRGEVVSFAWGETGVSGAFGEDQKTAIKVTLRSIDE